MNVYVAGVTGEQQYVKSLNAFHSLDLSPGDEVRMLDTFTRGDVTRMSFCDDFLDGDADAIAFLDLDMLHPKHLIQRLKSHNKDMVTAHYWKRSTPMESVCSVSPDGTWPYVPLKDFPTDGLMEIASTGLGAVLIKREVIETVKRSLPESQHPFSLGPMPEMTNAETSFGSDMRFFHLARKLGYKLWLDCGLESKHAATVWLGRELYNRLREPDWEASQLNYLTAINRDLYGDNSKTRQIELERLKHERMAINVKIQALEL